MNSALKNIVTSIGITELIRIVHYTPRILVWHSIDHLLNPTIEAEGQHIESFLQQIKYLKKRYDLISMDTFYERLMDDSFNHKEIVLTFDDGYKNNLHVVAPVLRRHQIPFTVFISTNHITNGDVFPTSLVRLIVDGSSCQEIDIPTLKIKSKLSTEKERIALKNILSSKLKTSPNQIVKSICNDLHNNISKDEFQSLISKYQSVIPLNWAEVNELRNFGGTIGSHCMDHFCCHSAQSNEETAMQIIESKKMIEQKTGTVCHYFAYPNGNYTPFSNQCVASASYRLGFSTQKKRITTQSDLNCMPRIQVPEHINEFKLHINIHPKPFS